jgi:hypothetical protein
MALVSAQASITWPQHWTSNAGALGASGNTAMTAGQYQAYVYQASEDMTIAYVGVRTQAAVASPTGTVAIYSVDTTSGLANADVNTTVTNINGGAALAASTFYDTALANSATITRGQYYCVRFAHGGSGTNWSVARITNLGGGLVSGFPYHDVNGVKTNLSAVTCLSLSSGNGTGFYQLPTAIPVITAGATPTLTTFSTSDGAGTERGLRFQVPFQCRLVGFKHYQGTNTGSFNAILRNDAFTELSSSSTLIEGAISQLTTSHYLVNYFDNPVTLEPGTWYRLGIQPTSTTNVGLGTIPLPSSAYMACVPGGANQHYFTYTTAGGPVDTATSTLPLLDLVLDQVNDAAGGAGGAHIIGG